MKTLQQIAISATLMLCGSFGFGVEAEPKSTMADLLRLRPDAQAIAQQELDKVQPQLHIRVRAGYQLAFVYDDRTGNSYYVEEIPAGRPLIMLVSEHQVLGIFQEDTDKPLGTADDCIEQEVAPVAPAHKWPGLDIP